MKKLIFVLILVALLGIPSAAMAGKPGDTCTTIQDGTLLRSDGVPIVIGYDEWGYNYQAHLFNGMYCDAYRDAAWCQPYKDVRLVMKWNDAWLSNKDCDGDGLLDRHYGFSSYIGSGAWTTNHQSGTYIGEDGKEHRWEWFVKIVAKPTAEYDCAANGAVEIWGDFCEIQSIYNDPYSGYHGVELKAVRPGLGNW
ncbi:MAG: hypothetical protein Kow0063_11700 [Anaerolineae bacterium]